MENRIKSLIKKLSRLGYHVKPKNNDHVDPVCGMKISSDLLKADHQGESYFSVQIIASNSLKKIPRLIL